MNRKQITLLAVILLVIAGWLVAGGEDVFRVATYRQMYIDEPVATAIGFFLVQMLGTALSLPFHGIVSVIGGIIFGVMPGFPLTLLACSIGGTLAFLSSRYIFHDIVQGRFGDQLKVINNGIREQGAFYVFSLRMIPVIPFWIINLLLGLTPVSAIRFFFATLFGLVPINLIFVFFGSQIGNIESFTLRDVFSPGMLIALALLAAVPFTARIFAGRLRRARKPES